MTTPETTIQAIRDREERGMEMLLKQYGPLMRYVLTPLLPDERDREECLQDAALKVWNGIGSFDETRGSWNAWLTSIVRNTALNCQRAERRRQAGELPEETEAPGPTPEEEALRHDRQETLLRALERLPRKERLLFYRKYYYGQSTAQIAAELGSSERSVEGKLYRVRKKLQELLKGEGYER